MLRLLFLLAAMLSAQVRAELVIEITDGVEDPIPVAFVPFRWQGSGALPLELADLIENNMERTGLFVGTPRENMLSRPSQGDQVVFRDWRLIESEYLVIGRVIPQGEQLVVEYELYDVFGQASLLSERIPGSAAQLRDIGHFISDRVYEQLTGQRGIFSTKLAYVTVEHRTDKDQSYRLMYADADGARPIAIFQSSQPIMSPAWSPEGQRIAYVSYESGRPEIYIQELASGTKTKVADYEGQNTAPSFSPDGRRLVFSSSRDGNPEIYIKNLRNNRLVRITKNAAIDTEPRFSADGDRILFTSTRAGNPHVYEYDVNTGRSQRLTFEGRYNSNPTYIPGDDQIAFVHQFERDYQIAVMQPQSGALQVLTASGFDENPSPAPNGQMMVYATSNGGKGVLGIVSVDGRVNTLIPSTTGDVREPAWSPFLN
ncbi:MAG: Tol-Pal system beta propeller repeat protein TolB [Litorivicinus sp.]